MKRFVLFSAFAALVAAPSVAPAQSSGYGVGPHGWDYYIGSWTCTNTMASNVSGPATVTLKISTSNAGAPLFFRATGPNFDESGYVAYSAKTKVWSNPVAYADGSYSFESTTQTGKKTTWAGSYFNAASGTTVQEQDTYTLSSGKYTDLNQTKIGGVWKTTGNSICTKS
jgi:hypothetical protein